MKTPKAAVAGLFAAFAASLCCITPFLAFLAGITGIAGSIAWLEPFRPYLTVITIGSLALAWYQHWRSRKAAIECACEADSRQSWLHSRVFLGTITVFALVMLLFPTYVDLLYPNPENTAPIDGATQTVVVAVEGMTCAGCEEHIEYELGKLPGIATIRANADSGIVRVRFAPQKLSVAQVLDAIAQTGYTPTAHRILRSEHAAQ